MPQNSPKVLTTICARGGSKGLPGKNIRPLLGKPLLAYTIECVRACPMVGHVVVSTDSDEIAAVAEAWGVPVPFRRPAELATDTAAKIHSIRHAARYVEEHEHFSPDIVVDLDVGVPLRAPEDIAGCVDVLMKHPDLDGAITVYEAERNPYFNMVEFAGELVMLVKQAPQPVVYRQNAPPVYSFSPAVFAVRRTSLMSVVHLYEGRWGAHIVPRERGIDIDHELDFLFVELLMTRQQRA
jgi:N-acylneuraminate cytidylyltransferase/CMP-N,N'-diacetyllegionaminic acid synthase